MRVAARTPGLSVRKPFSAMVLVGSTKWRENLTELGGGVWNS